MPRVEMITSVERRRRWSREEREHLVAASLEPGLSVSEVARWAGIHGSQFSGGVDHPVDTEALRRVLDALGPR